MPSEAQVTSQKKTQVQLLKEQRMTAGCSMSHHHPPTQRMEESTVPGGSTSDLCLHWSLPLSPFMLLLTPHSSPRPAFCPHSDSRHPPPLQNASFPPPSRRFCSFSSPHSLLLFLHSNCLCHQQTPELSFTNTEKLMLLNCGVGEDS